jgi:predicted DNA-binding protein (UPF0251 family)/predicted Fe-Mo cluster-binding NifX family protein
MPRPRKCRLVQAQPSVTCFTPLGACARELEAVRLSLEGLEALRLADLEGLRQEQAADRMGVSRQTFGRVLAEARRNLAETVVLGRMLCIEGGAYRVAAPAERRGDQKENEMAKIAISSEGPTLDDLVDPRFGRAGGFVVVDSQTMETNYLDNGASQARSQGAGIQAAELMARSGVEVVLTGFVGPKAFQALAAAGIRIGQDLGGISVRDAVARFQAGQVTMASGPNR